ncbi:replication factor C subunit 4 [Anthonomus grandis grandis]|uniref:replication factor C subunit 4 n=1 Tax=Anthonomus grandis grandis TaxID=2921223 RepID=UPI002166025F|nr:replication factor C subunit 4 [Anthonomus grandis grandis]
MHAFLKSGKLGEPSDDKNKSSTSDSSKKKQQKVQWVEKYRPKTVEDVVEQKEAVAVLQQCILGADLPNMLFYGPPGTGKTSTILAAAHQLFGDLHKERILELNASDERGIQVIRDKIKTFSQLTVNNSRADGKTCPPLKIVILDEADAMTSAAQAALRRTMEKETKTTRFCLLCNYVSRLIEPITSRCSKFRFKPLNESFVMERLRQIAKSEEVLITDEVLNALVKQSGGDLRRAITALQSCANLKGKANHITLENVYEVLTVVPNKWIEEFFELCAKRTDVKDLINFVQTLEQQAYPNQKLFEQINDALIDAVDVTDAQKAEIGEYLAECSYRSTCSRADFTHLLDFAANVQDILTVPVEVRRLKVQEGAALCAVQGVA